MPLPTLLTMVRIKFTQMQLCSTHSTQTLLRLSFIENPPKFVYIFPHGIEHGTEYKMFSKYSQ